MILQQTIYIHNSSVELKSEYSCVVDQIRESLWKIKKSRPSYLSDCAI